MYKFQKSAKLVQPTFITMNRYAILYAALPLIDFFGVEVVDFDVVVAFVVVAPVVGNV